MSEREKKKGMGRVMETEREREMKTGSEILAILTATQNVVTVIKTSTLSLFLSLPVLLSFLSVLALCKLTMSRIS